MLTLEQNSNVVNYPYPIAFLGKAGSGKTTASIVLQRLEPVYTPVSFARALKVASATIWPEPGREELQWLGNAARQFDPDVWINNASVDIETAFKSHRVPVIDDCRFPNEVDCILDYGFFTVRLECREEIRVDRLMRNGRFQSQEQLSHITETALDDYVADFTIDTTPFDGSMEDINDAIKNVLERLKRRT